MKISVLVLFAFITVLFPSCTHRDIWTPMNQRLGATSKYFLYFANNINGGSGDIYRYEIDMPTGALSGVISSGLGYENSYIALSPSQQTIYATTPSGHAVRSFSVNSPDGNLAFLSMATLSYAPDSEIAVSPNGRYLFGSAPSNSCVYDIAILSDGSLFSSSASETSSLIDAPKAFALSSAGNFIYVANYNTNFVNRYSVDMITGAIASPITTADQYATNNLPQAAAIHPTRNYMYVACDAASPVIQTFAIDGSGGLTPGSSVSTGGGPTSIKIDPSGNFLYCVSSWGPSSIYGFRISPTDGSLSALTNSPYAVPDSTTAVIVLEHIAIDPSGSYLYGPINGAGFVEGYSINHSTGELSFISSWSYPGSTALNPVIAAVPQ